MNTNEQEVPFEIKVSFNKLFQKYENLMETNIEALSERSKGVLAIEKEFPILKEGFSDLDLISTYQPQIDILLHDIFNPLLTHNEIKTAQAPLHYEFFQSTERFKSILSAAGKDFELEVKNMPYDQRYIIGCSIILKVCYGYNLNFKRPFYYEIPDTNGVTKYYKILYNADFVEVYPKATTPQITEEDFYILLDNFDNIALWKEKFPPNSYEFKGFIISNIVDVTDDQSISNIKSSLIGEDNRKKDDFMDGFQDIFRSFLGLKDIKVGFSIYNKDDNTFEKVHGKGITSFLLNKKETVFCTDALCRWSYKMMLHDNKYFAISDVDKAYIKSQGKAPQVISLFQQGLKSAIFAPIANAEGLMGILEIVSEYPRQLNSIIANKLVDIMPYIVSAVERSTNEEENLIEAIIQKECTSIHPSVHWRFKEEARNYIKQTFTNEEATFKPIVFENIYPLYGQIDIKGSSEARNWATKEDLTLQLNAIKTIINTILEEEQLPIYHQYLFQINNFIKALSSDFQVDSEQQINKFIKLHILPLLKHLSNKKGLDTSIAAYHNSIDKKTNTFYQHRKAYDETITLINKSMASLLDEKQIKAQAMYPHYFERFKTDGVEHNMYIGEAITKEENYNSIYLYNLRLWQLQVMCEMENAFYQMQASFPIKLNVASMILVFNQPLSISFRMDEKQFDVDGTYNARYEIVKKRVDKANIKGTTKRVTQKGKISIVYSQKQDETEYLRYVKFLQSKNYLDNDIEIVELEDLQAVTGLKALRVSVLYHKNKEDKAYYTYKDLMKEISG